MHAVATKDIATGRFHSILGTSPEGSIARATEDDVLHDLALDQVLDRLIEKAPAAADAFRTPCPSVQQVVYRQEVFAAVEHREVRAVIDRFLGAMAASDAADAAAARPSYPWQGELARLDAVLRYGAAVTDLAEGLSGCEAAMDAPGLRALVADLDAYRAMERFRTLAADAQACRKELSELRENVFIRGARVSVAATDEETDLRERVLDVFARFRDSVQNATVDPPARSGFDHVQGWILEKTASVHPGAFRTLSEFAGATEGYRDEVVERFAAEIWFYLAWLDHIAPMRSAGLPFCRPRVSATDKRLDAHGTFDVALATRLVRHDADVVRNDIALRDGERVIVISGPNQGGKSTLARTFGQLHHLAAVGAPVPGTDAEIFLCDSVFTAFEREEQLDDLAGRLGAEVQRMHAMLQQATGRSVLVLNEVFSSTALADAKVLTRDVLERVLAADALAVCVTFIDELSRIDERTVSMVSTVDPDDPARRTFRLERRRADGRAHARALARAHGLTGEQISQRLGQRDVDARHDEHEVAR